jgi:HK97 family phage major capsid protein
MTPTSNFSARSSLASELRTAANNPTLPYLAKIALREGARKQSQAIIDSAAASAAEAPSSFPSFIELARAARTSVSCGTALDREMRDTQEALRARFPAPGMGYGDSIVFPWESRSAMSATGEVSTTGDEGGMTIGVDVPSIGLALRDKLVLAQLGATMLFNLRGELHLPREIAGINAEWCGENVAASAAGAPLLNMLSLSPHRVSAFFDVSEELLLQGEAIEPFVRSALMAALAEAIQQIVVNGTGANSQPLGILRTPGIGSVVAAGGSGSAPLYGDVEQLEYLVTNAKADRGNLGFLTSPKVRKTLRNVWLRPAGSDPAALPIWGRDTPYQLLGHPAGVTTSVPDSIVTGAATTSALIFGEWSELFLGFWGPGVLVDVIPVTSGTSAMQGLVRFVARAYFDGGIRSVEAFAAKQDCIVS